MKKKALITLVILLLPVLLFAGGTWETVSSMWKGAGVGALIGSIFLPGLGTIIGAALGGAAGYSQGKEKAEARINEYEDTIDAYETSVDEYKTNITNYESLIDASQTTVQNLQNENAALGIEVAGLQSQAAGYQTWLDNYEYYYNETYGAQKYEAETTLYNAKSNWADIEASMASRGMTTGSSVLIADAAKNRVVDLAGDDMLLTVGEGILGSALKTTMVSLESEKAATQANLTYANSMITLKNNYISQNLTSITEHEASITANQQNIEDEEENIRLTEEAIRETEENLEWYRNN